MHAYSGFTLVELLVVIGIIVFMTGLGVSVFSWNTGAKHLGQSAYNILGFLEQARSYAMGNNTYVFVGVDEFDASLAESTAVQAERGVGCVALVAVASRDGAWVDVSSSAGKSNLFAFTKMQRFERLHMTSLPSSTGSANSMSRPSESDGVVQLTDSADSVSLGWPLNAGTANYTFKRIIAFDPRGTARLQTKTTRDTAVPGWIEIGLQYCPGTTAPAAPTGTTSGNQAAIQVDGMTGAVRLYQP